MDDQAYFEKSTPSDDAYVGNYLPLKERPEEEPSHGTDIVIGNNTVH